ncbi:YHS domain-containing (seleno)protein [Chryseosolibacter indicus]|uniref:YHS domain protein n=1 Tax=Chryseosolibacter indicus TaxID=2782351 RepID=A0ABS5VXP2_9BACT|nr:YHS domain-containing (seleno)protein [Chryseosolibacter indicus]MBT1705635.1 YHS domain protein [Chryseosolibacter indicus]
MKHIIILAALCIAAAYNTQAQRAEIFSTEGKAIKGYDAVAFFTEGKAIPGVDSLAHFYKGTRWLFSSRKNMDAFKANAEQYTPQYGGYCAYGTANGHKAPTETDTWTVVDGKLYFNYNQKVKGLWMKEQSQLIQKADEQWPLIKDRN